MMIVMGALCGQLHLFRTEKKLRQKEEAFMQAVVHNMKNPVSVVKSCVETLTDEDIDRVPRLKAMASDKLKMNAASLSSLVSQSMVLFDIVQGTKLRKEKVNIEQTIAYWMDVFGEITNKTVTYKLDFQVKELLAEKDMFREMIGNLISNSIKYSGDSVEIEISSKCDRKQVVFRIRDNGWGIPQKDRERIFRKYERIHINKDTLPGFGLGLTYVADAMKLHGGKVSVESKRGEGSEFSLYFPDK
jgi:two-component system phosphate regulon sensor histidine kinase PhoR